MKKFSIRFKIILAILTTCVSVAIIFGVIFYPFEIRRTQTRFEEIGILLSAVFQQKREELANEIFAGQRQAQLASLASMQKVKGIEVLTLYDASGAYLISTDPLDTPPLSPAERETLDQGPAFRRMEREDWPYAVYASAIQMIGEHVGYIKIYYNLEPLLRESRVTVFFFSSLLFTILMILFLMLNILLYSSVIRPVSLLRNAIRKIQAGELGTQVSITSRDEIGEMAEAFNAMSTRLGQQHYDLMMSIEARDLYFARLEETNQALERLNSGLESMIEERTKELRHSNQQLRQEIVERKRMDREKRELEQRLARSQKMEALGLLAGGVAHDLNNVLSGIVSYPDLILMDMPADSPLRKPLQTIQDSGQKAAAIVQDLLTLARRGVTSMQVLNLNEDIVRDYLASPEFARLQSYHPEVTVKPQLATDLMNIQGSTVHLKKTIMNLVSNAAEAQPDGGLIRIITENRYLDRPLHGYDSIEEGDYAVLTVTDTGTGIAPEDLNRIFEPFYTKKVMGRSGTGLGMAVVWGTVQDHDGYINVSSDPENGTVFELYFPVTRETPGRTDRPLSLPDFQGNGETVLVVDDVAEQREIASAMLRKLNYAVDAVPGGEAALAYVRHRPVDILLLDMIMEPGMDGLDTYRAILELCPDQKAVIASGFAENERVKEAQRRGAGTYLKKPYTMEKIGLALQTELRRKPKQEEDLETAEKSTRSPGATA